MPWGLWNIIFGRKTVAEDKRDKYLKLYTNMDIHLVDIIDGLNEVKSIHSIYKHNMPGLYIQIPAEEFSNAKMSLNIRLKAQIKKYEGLQEDGLTARKKAYLKYEYYRDLAIIEQNNLNQEDINLKDKSGR